MKLTRELRSSLMKVIKTHASNQAIKTNKDEMELRGELKEKFIATMLTGELTATHQRLLDLKDEVKKLRDDLNRDLGKVGLLLSAADTVVCNTQSLNDINREASDRAGIDWPSRVAATELKLNLAETYEEAKAIVEAVCEKPL